MRLKCKYINMPSFSDYMILTSADINKVNCFGFAFNVTDLSIDRFPS